MVKKIIKAEVHPNFFRRTYHVNRVISRSVIEMFHRPLRDSSENYLKKVAEPGATVVRAVMRLSGITEVCIKPYELSVQIAETFDWDSIEPSVIRVLCKEVFHTGPEDVEINH